MIQCNDLQGSSEAAEVDNSQTLLNDNDRCELLAGPEPADVDAAVVEHNTNDERVAQLSAENVRIQLVDFVDIAISLLTCLLAGTVLYSLVTQAHRYK